MKTEVALSLSISTVVVVALIQIDPGPVERILLYLLFAAGGLSLIALKLHAPGIARLLIFLQCGGLIAVAFLLRLSPVAVFLAAAAALILACHCLDLRGKRQSYLTPEQRFIIYLVAAKGMTNKEIAFELCREEGSAGRKLTAIYRKLGVECRQGLSMWYHAHPMQRTRILYTVAVTRRERNTANGAAG